MDTKRLDRQFDFIREIDKEKAIVRQTYVNGGARKETDAEHAWHMAVMTVLLAEYARAPIDVLKTMTMLLIHDLVEIDAGDTYAYAGVSHEAQHEKEARCACRLFGMLPEDQGKAFRALWEEFEEGKTAEARFAHAMDNIQPMMLNDASGGRAWAEHGVHLAQVLGRNAHTAEGSDTLWEYAFSHFIKPHVGKELKE